jgi:hypothetical protein
MCNDTRRGQSNNKKGREPSPLLEGWNPHFNCVVNLKIT